MSEQQLIVRNLMMTLKRLGAALGYVEYSFWDPDYNRGRGREIVHSFMNGERVVL